jgi:hypothetical protein
VTQSSAYQRQTDKKVPHVERPLYRTELRKMIATLHGPARPYKVDWTVVEQPVNLTFDHETITSKELFTGTPITLSNVSAQRLSVIIEDNEELILSPFAEVKNTLKLDIGRLGNKQIRLFTSGEKTGKRFDIPICSKNIDPPFFKTRSLEVELDRSSEKPKLEFEIAISNPDHLKTKSIRLMIEGMRLVNRKHLRDSPDSKLKCKFELENPAIGVHEDFLLLMKGGHECDRIPIRILVCSPNGNVTFPPEYMKSSIDFSGAKADLSLAMARSGGLKCRIQVLGCLSSDSSHMLFSTDLPPLPSFETDSNLKIHLNNIDITRLMRYSDNPTSVSGPPCLTVIFRDDNGNEEESEVQLVRPNKYLPTVDMGKLPQDSVVCCDLPVPDLDNNLPDNNLDLQTDHPNCQVKLINRGGPHKQYSLRMKVEKTDTCETDQVLILKAFNIERDIFQNWLLFWKQVPLWRLIVPAQKGKRQVVLQPLIENLQFLELDYSIEYSDLPHRVKELQDGKSLQFPRTILTSQYVINGKLIHANQQAGFTIEAEVSRIGQVKGLKLNWEEAPD